MIKNNNDFKKDFNILNDIVVAIGRSGLFRNCCINDSGCTAFTR